MQLSAKQQTIQLVIDNLHISTLEYRNENDHDVSPYIHNREIELIEVLHFVLPKFCCLLNLYVLVTAM